MYAYYMLTWPRPRHLFLGSKDTAPKTGSLVNGQIVYYTKCGPLDFWSIPSESELYGEFRYVGAGSGWISTNLKSVQKLALEYDCEYHQVDESLILIGHL
jgi:hypothetical protein